MNSFDVEALFPNQTNFEWVERRRNDLRMSLDALQDGPALKEMLVRQISVMNDWIRLATMSVCLRVLAPARPRFLTESDLKAPFCFWKQELIIGNQKNRRRCIRLGGDTVLAKVRTIRDKLILGSLDEYVLGQIRGDVFIPNEPLERFAVKNYMKEKLGQAKEDMAREIAIQARLAELHLPYYLPLLQYMEIHDRFMALIPFMPCSDILDYTENFEVSNMQPMMTTMILALKTIHALGISHGDISPENFLVRDASSAVLMDFGMASDMDENWTIDGGEFRGKMAYAAPEVIGFLTPRWDGRKIDIWSLGITFFVMFRRAWPWTAASASIAAEFRTISRNIPAFIAKFLPENEVRKGLADLISSMLQLDPAQRPTASQLLAHQYFR